MSMQWPIEEASLSTLALDPRNVRVREGRGDGPSALDREGSDAAIAKYMLETEQLTELVSGILRDGYLDNEIPVVVREADEFVVLEGNRRVTALKVIENPTLLGDRAAPINRLVSRYPNHSTPTTIRVMIAPSEDAAQPLLARLHTGQPKKAWIREQQAIFYHAQLSEMTVDELCVRYPAEARRIPKKIRMGEMREVIRKLRYDDPELRDFVLNSELKMTSFEYAYTPKKIHEALGLAFHKNGQLVSKDISENQRRALMYLLARFKNKTLNTRSPELMAKNREDHERLAEQLRQIVAGGHISTDLNDPLNTGRPTDAGARDTSPEEHVDRPSPTGLSADQHLDPTPDGAEAENSPSNALPHQGGARGPNRGDTKSRLDMSGLTYKGTSTGLRRRIEELQNINVQSFPNATQDLVRTVLECAIKEYFQTQLKPLRAKATIGSCIEELSKAFQSDAQMTALINAINRKGRMKSEQYAGTADALNASNHEPHLFAEPRDAHAAWDRIKPVLAKIVG